MGQNDPTFVPEYPDLQLSIRKGQGHVCMCVCEWCKGQTDYTFEAEICVWLLYIYADMYAFMGKKMKQINMFTVFCFSQDRRLTIIDDKN